MAKTSAVPPADKIFAGKVFVLQGDFGRFPRTHLNIARLIARHGGRVDSTVTDRTTLLVTTIEEFQKRPPASKFAFVFISLLLSGPPLTFGLVPVEKAISLGKARCRIVQWEYVEDSIFTKNGKPRVISANFHEIQSVLKRQNRLSEAKAIYKKTFIKDANSMKGLADAGRWFLFPLCSLLFPFIHSSRYIGIKTTRSTKGFPIPHFYCPVIKSWNSQVIAQEGEAQ